MWGIFLTIPVVVTFIVLSRGQGRSSGSGEDSFDIGFFILMVIAAAFFLFIGVISYLILLFSDGLTFNFQKPFWPGMKGKLYFANIVVQSAIGIALGLFLLPFLVPVLVSFGVSRQMAFVLPVVGTIVLLQIVHVFVLMWAPLERRLIPKRLQARGITPAQLQTAFLVGISNPLRSSFKKLTAVEDDIGALWVGPDQLIYWGDSDQFAFNREQLTQIERTADSGGTTMLGGVTHLILHCAQPDGTERQIRLHAEGAWTLAAKGRAMDALEQRILSWHTGQVSAVAAS